MVSKVTNSIYRGQADSEKNKTNKQQKKVGQSGFKTIGNRNIHKPHTQSFKPLFFPSTLLGTLQKLAIYQSIRQNLTYFR